VTVSINKSLPDAEVKAGEDPHAQADHGGAQAPLISHATNRLDPSLQQYGNRNL
jgi:hypothetical protein